MRAAAYQCFDHVISEDHNYLYPAFIIGTLISDWHVNQPGYARVVKMLKNCRFITLKIALWSLSISYIV